MSNKKKDVVVLVGAGSIGQAIARRWAQEGMWCWGIFGRNMRMRLQRYWNVEARQIHQRCGLSHRWRYHSFLLVR